MDTKKIYKAAEKAGFDIFETCITKESKLSVSCFNGEVENITVSDCGNLKVRGVIDGKCGSFKSDCTDDSVIDTAIAAVRESAVFGQEVDPDVFVSGKGFEYQKVNNYNEALDGVPADEYIRIAKAIYSSVKAEEPRIEVVEVSVDYCKNSVELANNRGLDVATASNYVMIFAGVKVVDGDQVENGSHYAIISDIAGFDAQAFSKQLVRRAVEKLGGGDIKSGKYKAVFSPDCVAPLVHSLLSSFSAFNAEQHMSLLEGKVGQKVFSPLFTLSQTPIGDDVFCSPFDAEGVPCRNGKLIDNGVFTGYVYDLATAKRAGVTSTGNGVPNGSVVRPGVDYATVDAGDSSLEKLFEKIGDGVYVTELQGVHAGLNAQSGNYSLQASGFRIQGGKRTEAISLMTVAGSIMDNLADIIAVGNDEKLTYYGVKTPSLAIGEITVSGK